MSQKDTYGTVKDELFDDAVRIVLKAQRGSFVLLQRELGIGYTRASWFIETMVGVGILGERKGCQAREVTMTLDEYERKVSNGKKNVPSNKLERK